jgi:hypothetical protein
MKIELTVEEFKALFAQPEAEVCGRSYDGKCPMPRPEPATDDHSSWAQEFAERIAAANNAREEKRREHVQEQQVGIFPWEERRVIFGCICTHEAAEKCQGSQPRSGHVCICRCHYGGEPPT